MAGVLDKETKDYKPYIGKHGKFEPKLCAVTGQKAPRDRACTNIALGNGYYYRVLAKATSRTSRADKEAIAKALEKGMSTLAGKQPTVVVEEKGNKK